jgi:peptidyl-prolyl cis-trans isomerase SurA
MLHHSRRIVALLVAAAAAFSLSATIRAGEIIEAIIVKVNGDILTKTDLESREVSAIRQRGQQNLTDQQLKQAIAEVTPQILVDTIDEMLILQRGRDLGYKLSDEQFKEVLERIKKDNKIETDEQFEAALKQENLTVAELRKSIEKNMIINRVQQNEVMGKISVSEEEARRYYDSHQNEFLTPVTMMIREMLVAVNADPKGMLNVAKDDDAKARAEALRERIVGGESFEKLAGEANDAASKANNGLIGPIKLEELAPELRKIFEPMKAGAITPVIRTSRGYQFFKVESKAEQAVMAFDQARDQIANKVAQTKQRGEFQKFLARIRAEAIIEWKNLELKKIYDARVAADAAEAAKGPVIG